MRNKLFYISLIFLFILLIFPGEAYAEEEEYFKYIRPYIAVSRGPSFLGDQLLAGVEDAGFHEDIDFEKTASGFTGMSLGIHSQRPDENKGHYSLEREAWGDKGKIFAEGTIHEGEHTWEYDIDYSSEALFVSYRLHYYHDMLPERDRLYIMPSFGFLSIIGEWEIEGSASYDHIEGPYEEDIEFADDFFEIEDEEDDIALGYSAGIRGEAFPLSWLGVFGELRYTLADFDDFVGDFDQFDIASRYSVIGLSGGLVINIDF